MPINKKTAGIVLLIWVVTCGLIHFLTKWTAQHEFNKERATYILNDSAMQKKVRTITDEKGREITQYKLIAISSQQLATSKSAEAEQLRKDLKKVKAKPEDVRSSVTIHSDTHDEVTIAVGDSLPPVKPTDTATISVVVSSDSVEDRWVIVTGTAQFKPLPSGGYIFKTLDLKVGVENVATVTHVLAGNFFEKKQMNLLIAQDNPHTKTGKVQSYFITINKKWYEKWYVHAAAGAVVTLVGVHYLK